jgi:peptide deformylase
MILPVTAFGDPVLRKMTNDISTDYPDLKELIASMFETMYHANGVGLAASQIGLPIRLFILDTAQLKEEDKKVKEPGIKQVFINATMLNEQGDPWSYEEGCLSIPGIRENVIRRPEIEIEYLDENFEYQRSTFDKVTARVIQHEYDHMNGVLFTDHLKPLKKKLLKRRLGMITKGEIEVKYRMRFPAIAR